MPITLITNRVERLIGLVEPRDIAFLLATNIEINKYKSSRRKISAALYCLSTYNLFKDYVIEFYLKENGKDGKLRCVWLENVGVGLRKAYKGLSAGEGSRLHICLKKNDLYFDTSPGTGERKRKGFIEKAGIVCSVLLPANASGVLVVSKTRKKKRLEGEEEKEDERFDNFDKYELKLLKYFTELILAPSIDLALDNEKNLDSAIHEPLTGLFNRGYFMFQLRRELAIRERTKAPLSLLLMDIDFFKQYNDTHGHIAGDNLLVEISKLFIKTLRRTDIVARYGGEEFVVMLPNTKLRSAKGVAEKIRSAVNNYKFKGGETQPKGRITISIGVSGMPEHGNEAEMLVKAADEGLYECKGKGKDAVCVVK